MKYCENCHMLTDSKRCPICGDKYLRPPEPEDYCLFCEKEMVWADALEDILRQNGIPYVTEDARGAWLAVNLGQTFVSKRFYVPYAYLDMARSLETDFFDGDFQMSEGAEDEAEDEDEDDEE